MTTIFFIELSKIWQNFADLCPILNVWSLTVTDLLTNLGKIFFSYRINSKRVIFETVVILLDRYHF